MSWPVSISLFAVPLALALFTFAMPRLSASPEIAIRVTDRYTGQQISGAMLVIGEGAMSTGPDGTVTVGLPNDNTTVTIQAPGYEAITTTLSRGGSPGLAGGASSHCVAGQIGRRRNLGWDRTC